MDSDLATSVEHLAKILTRKQLTLVAAESCTGGLLAASLTDVAGSSGWFEGAFVTYRLSAKQQYLGVRTDTLDRWGAVSEPIVREMAEGALEHSTADVSVAITGVAGPGGQLRTPQGTVWLAWANRSVGILQSSCYRFCGERSNVRQLAVEQAVWGLLKLLDDASKPPLCPDLRLSNRSMRATRSITVEWTSLQHRYRE